MQPAAKTTRSAVMVSLFELRWVAVFVLPVTDFVAAGCQRLDLSDFAKSAQLQVIRANIRRGLGGGAEDRAHDLLVKSLASAR